MALAPESKELHQAFLDESLQGIINLNRQISAGRKRLERNKDKLHTLVISYGKERRQRQEEIWAARGLVRCTSCHDVGPDHTESYYDRRKPTDQGGWGLTLAEDARYIQIEGSLYYMGGYSPLALRQPGYHCFCPNCIKITAEYCQEDRKDIPQELPRDYVDYLNKAVDEELADSKHFQMYTGPGYGNHYKVWWRDLEIPEEAYEIGRQLPRAI